MAATKLSEQEIAAELRKLSGWSVVALAVLQHLGVLESDLPDRLLPFASVTLRNWAGRDVGEIRAELESAWP